MLSEIQNSWLGYLVIMLVVGIILWRIHRGDKQKEQKRKDETTALVKQTVSEVAKAKTDVNDK